MSAAAPFPEFAVACGEEASDPLVTYDGRTVRVDELAASAHLEHQDADLASVASLGVELWRYGMPWRLVEPEPGVYDWKLWDQAFAACERNGLKPIVDLCHFGLPDHYGGFCEPGWVPGFLSYVESFAERYPDPVLFTPVNEPMITAMCSGLWGIWNDRRSSRADYMRALSHVTLANLEALQILSSDRDAWWIGAEGFGCHLAATPSDQPNADAARDLEQLTWDLHFGVEPPASVRDVYDVIDAGVLERISRATVGVDRVVAGHDLYPVSVTVHGGESADLSVTELVDAYDREARRWFQRYRRPFWVAETSNLGLAVADGPRWLGELLVAIERMRSDSVPVRGVCWYSRGDQYDWQTMLTSPVGEVTEVGLFDAQRRVRPVAADFAELARVRSTG